MRNVSSRRGTLVVLIVVGASLFGNGCRSPGHDPTETGGVLLDGAADQLALEAAHDFVASNAGITEDEIVTDEQGYELPRTIFVVAVQPSATVGEVNALLQAQNARIVAMLAGVAIFVVRVPDPGSLDQVRALAAALESNPVVRWAEADELPGKHSLPSNVPVANQSLIAHQLAVRGAAAWNAIEALRATVADKPLLVVADFFGDGTPSNTVFEGTYTNADYGEGARDDHGYGVLSVITATLEGPADAAGMVTGLDPTPSTVRVSDFWGCATVGHVCKRTPTVVTTTALIHARSTAGHVVLNTSYGFPCSQPGKCNDRVGSEQRGGAWAEMVRGTLGGGANLESRMLQVASTGNIYSANETDAALGSPFAAAALLTTLNDGSGHAIPRLTNTIVVESSERDAQPPYAIGCRSDFSKSPGHMAAIGRFVFMASGSSNRAAASTGTSFAAPQVAAAAAMVWGLRPDLDAQGVKALLLDAASPPDANCATPPAPALDVYAAVLATDGAGRGNPVRAALLDTDHSGTFDGADIAAFLQAFQTAAGRADFSRYDLNGDGYTGGAATSRFDLDQAATSPRYTTVTATTSNGLTMSFDENAVTDLDVLCYYAYASPLYDARAVDARDQLLQSRCAKNYVRLTLPPYACPGSAFRIEARAQRPVPPGSSTSQAGNRIDIEVVNGRVVGSRSGETDDLGYFYPEVELLPGAASMEVRATGSDPSGHPLGFASGTISAVPAEHCRGSAIQPADCLLLPGYTYSARITERSTYNGTVSEKIVEDTFTRCGRGETCGWHVTGSQRITTGTRETITSRNRDVPSGSGELAGELGTWLSPHCTAGGQLHYPGPAASDERISGGDIQSLVTEHETTARCFHWVTFPYATAYKTMPNNIHCEQPPGANVYVVVVGP